MQYVVASKVVSVLAEEAATDVLTDNAEAARLPIQVRSGSAGLKCVFAPPVRPRILILMFVHDQRICTSLGHIS